MTRKQITLAALAATALTGGTPAFAGICASTVSCTLDLTQTNAGLGGGAPVTGFFGTANFALSGNTVTVTVSLIGGGKLINTGFPGTFGFADSLGGGLTIGNFSTAGYSGAVSDPTNDLHFDGFGFANDAAATTGPHAGSADAVSLESFTVTGSGLVDVNQLLNLFNPAGGDGAAYFVVDAIEPGLNGRTGLIAITGGGIVTTGGGGGVLPEPASLTLLGGALAGLGMLRRRMKK